MLQIHQILLVLSKAGWVFLLLKISSLLVYHLHLIKSSKIKYDESETLICVAPAEYNELWEQYRQRQGHMGGTGLAMMPLNPPGNDDDDSTEQYHWGPKPAPGPGKTPPGRRRKTLR